MTETTPPSQSPDQESASPGPIAPIPSITNELATFIRNAHAISDTLPIALTALNEARKTSDERYRTFLEDKGTLTSENAHTKSYNVPPAHYPQLLHLKRDYESTRAGQRILPQTAIVSLVAMFDAFVGGLLRCLFTIKPQILDASERSLPFSQLSEFSSIEEAKQFIIEKEIESILRKSHPDQFEWLEKRFSIPLRKDLPSWSTFIEVTERRHMFVHTGGRVTDQYLAVCRRHNVQFQAEPQLGDQLRVTPSYFKEAYTCFVEIAVKLAQVLWRKLTPTSLADADTSLIATTYDLLVLRQYDLAVVLLEFACFTLKKYCNDENRRICVINLAQAYKWTRRNQDCTQLVNQEDWTSSSAKFRLGVAVLLDDFEKASSLMRQQGPKGEVAEHDYRTWPLFQEFRRSQEFASAFEDIFGFPFTATADAPAQSEGDPAGP